MKRGVPSRNGIRKHRVIDAPVFPVQPTALRPAFSPPQYLAGSRISLRHGIHTKIGRALCAERGECFIISMRLEQEHKDRQVVTRRSGYRELHGSLWRTLHTKPCSHPPESGLDTEYELPISTTAIAVQNDDDVVHAIIVNTVVAYLSTNSSAARWRGLIAINMFGATPARPSRTMLRTNDCCCHCAIQQAMLQPVKCFIVL